MRGIFESNNKTLTLEVASSRRRTEDRRQTGRGCGPCGRDGSRCGSDGSRCGSDGTSRLGYRICSRDVPSLPQGRSHQGLESPLPPLNWPDESRRRCFACGWTGRMGLPFGLRGLLRGLVDQFADSGPAGGQAGRAALCATGRAQSLPAVRPAIAASGVFPTAAGTRDVRRVAAAGAARNRTAGSGHRAVPVGPPSRFGASATGRARGPNFPTSGRRR